MNALDAWEAELPFAVSCLPAANHGLNYVRTAAEPCTAPNIDPRYVVAHQATCYPGEMHNVKDRTEFRDLGQLRSRAAAQLHHVWSHWLYLLFINESEGALNRPRT